MHRIDLKRLGILGFCKLFDRVANKCFIACKTKCEHNCNTYLFYGTLKCIKDTMDNVRESQVRAL